MGFLGLGGTEILIIIVIAAILFFGGRKIPEFAKGLGRAMGEFRRGRLEVEKEIQSASLDRSVPDDTARTLEK